MTLFVDTSVWFAAASKRDHDNANAKSILQTHPDHVTTDHVLVETWLLMNSRYGKQIAELFWSQLRHSAVRLELVTAADLESAWTIGSSFRDQDFSLVDRTSFAVMERLGITKVASFDSDFLVYRYGRKRNKAFEVVRSGPSPAFLTLHRAILERKQVTLSYQGVYREVCPHILGHTAGTERALVFQFGGSTKSRLPAGGEWRCLLLSQVKNAQLRGGPWHTKGYHRKTQRCVDKVFVDVNENVPDQPGRRAAAG